MIDAFEIAYLLFSGALAAAGIAMVGLAIQAYRDTQRREMFHLSVGFALVVAAVLSTTISAFLQDFQSPEVLLTVQYFVMTLGFLFVIYSIIVD